MTSPSPRVSAWLHYGWQRLGKFYAPWLHERQGIDLASGACVNRFSRSKHALMVNASKKLVLAAPQREFRMQVLPLEATLSRPQLMEILQARRVVTKDTAIDVLVEPMERASIAVFSLSCAQREAWQSCYQTPARFIVAIEPDVHALSRYAQHQHAAHQPWLVTTPQQNTLYWPTAWPWGYHAEPLPAVTFERASLHLALHTAIRRACLMTNNEAPNQEALRLAGSLSLCQHWQRGVDDIEWHASDEPHPVAAGAALKTQRRWV